MPHTILCENMVDGYSIETSQNHFSIGFCWGLNFTYGTKPCPSEIIWCIFSPRREENTQNCERKRPTGQTAFLRCPLMNQPTQILKFGVDSWDKKPALEVLRCRYLSLNDEWICMNYWLMWMNFSRIFLTSSGHLEKFDKVLVVDTCNRKES